MGTESTQALSRTEHPVGATRSAERLTERTGLEVGGADVDLLAERWADNPVEDCTLITWEPGSSMAGNVDPQHAFTGDRTYS
jgi:hypothetical protein